MKRSKESTRAMRHKATAPTHAMGGQSRYGLKVRSGKQMYGNGSVCCAHHYVARGSK